MGKLDTHFGSATDASALKDYLHFARNDQRVDMLFSKEEPGRIGWEILI